MDQTVLVNSGQALVTALDNTDLKPRFAMWVHSPDQGTWKLWIVPGAATRDAREFYRQVSQVISKNRVRLGGIDASDTEMVADSHPALKGLAKFIRAPGLNAIAFSGNTFDGFYMPDGIILRSDL